MEKSVSPLARAVYQLLRQRTALADPRITYAELVRALRDASATFETLTHRSHELYVALNEVGQKCRRLGLPLLPALVVRADTRRPGAAYYAESAAALRSQGEQIALWREDLEAVRRAVYPKR